MHKKYTLTDLLDMACYDINKLCARHLGYLVELTDSPDPSETISSYEGVLVRKDKFYSSEFVDFCWSWEDNGILRDKVTIKTLNKSLSDIDIWVPMAEISLNINNKYLERKGIAIAFILFMQEKL